MMAQRHLYESDVIYGWVVYQLGVVLWRLFVFFCCGIVFFFSLFVLCSYLGQKVGRKGCFGNRILQDKVMLFRLYYYRIMSFTLFDLEEYCYPYHDFDNLLKSVRTF